MSAAVLGSHAMSDSKKATLADSTSTTIPAVLRGSDLLQNPDDEDASILNPTTQYAESFMMHLYANKTKEYRHHLHNVHVFQVYALPHPLVHVNDASKKSQLRCSVCNQCTVFKCSTCEVALCNYATTKRTCYAQRHKNFLIDTTTFSRCENPNVFPEHNNDPDIYHFNTTRRPWL